MSTPAASPVVWGRVTLRADNRPGKGACTTQYHRDGPLRPELNDALSTVRISAAI